MEKINIEDVFNELKKSPLYNLSMSSLENFHTNFLVWLGNKHPEQTWTLLTGEQETPPNIKFEAQKNCGKNCKFDLCVKEKEKDNIILVLENKIKSYPTEEQLEKYNEVIENQNCKKILLTLFPFEIKNQDQCKGWIVITHSKLAEDWKNFFNLRDVIYPEALVIDYFNMIEKIDEIVKIVKEEEHLEEYDIYEIADKLEDFHDVYVKYRTFNLMNFIKEYVKEKRIDTKNIKFSTDFSNSNEGVINIEKQYNEKIILSIQIQGQEYRHCLVYDKGVTKQDRYNFAEELKFWFNDKKMNTYTKRSSYACCQRDEDEGIKYRGYSPDRIYRHIDINNLKKANANKFLSYNSIAKKVLADIQNLNNNDNIKIITCYTKTLS